MTDLSLTVYADGWLKSGDKVCRAAYGRSGIGPKLREGDGISPEGCWPLREVFYRPDRLEKPLTGLPVRSLATDDAWCDIPGDANYNRLVKLPYAGISEERLWRDDHLYDVIVVIGYNDAPVIDGRGSAIFLHGARDNFAPSAGCAAVSIPELLDALKDLGPRSTLTFTRERLKGSPVAWAYRPPQPR